MKTNPSKNQSDFLSNRFESLVENGLDSVIIVSATGETMYVSRSITNILGYTVDEAMRLNIMEFAHPDDIAGAQAAIVKSLENPGVPIQGHTSRVRHKNGSWIWIEAVITNMLHDPSINGIVDNFRDVTDKVIAQEKANESTHRLLLATQGAKIGIWDYDLNNLKMVCNDIMFEAYGVEKDSFDGTFEYWLNFVHPDDLDQIVQKGAKILEDGADFSVEYRIIRTDGEIRYLKSLAQVIKDSNGKPNRMLGANWDITEQKLAEIELVRKNQLLSIAEKITLLGNWQWDLKTNIVLWSANLYNIFNVEENTELVFDTYFSFVHPEDRKRVTSHIAKSFEDKHFTALKHRINLKNGLEKTIRLSAEIVNDDLGNAIELIGSCQDITEQTLAETELLRKNELLSIAESITRIGNWQWNLTTNYIKWSANLYRIFNVEDSVEIDYDTYFSFVHPEDQSTVTAHVEKSLADNYFIDLTHRIILRNGTIKTIQLLAKILTDDKGNATEMIGTCQDVTEQRMVENKFRGLLESAPDAMVIINENNLIELVNSETERMFDYSKSELIGKPIELLLPNDFKKKLIAHKGGHLTSINASKKGKMSSFFGIKKNLVEFPVEINLGTLHTDDGLLISIAIRDITIRKKTEALLRKMEAIKAKNEEMEELAYITSHDLKEPLLTLKKYSQVLNTKFKDTLGENGKILLDTIIQSANRMETRINDLLDYSQLGQEKQLEQVDCNDIVKMVTQDLHSLVETNGAQIITDTLPSEIKAYPTELQLIFQNLINNAIKFNTKGKPPIVRISSKKTIEGWEFQVADNGIGIQKKDFKKIFSIFQKLHNDSEYHGSGIGLAQVKKLVELHNGQIRVESTLGKGTSFTFTIITENL